MIMTPLDSLADEGRYVPCGTDALPTQRVCSDGPIFTERHSHPVFHGTAVVSELEKRFARRQG